MNEMNERYPGLGAEVNRGPVGCVPRDGEDGRDDVLSLMGALEGKSTKPGKTIKRLITVGSIPQKFRNMMGTEADVMKFRDEVLDTMRSLRDAANNIPTADRKINNATWMDVKYKAYLIGLDADAWAVAFDLVREQEAKDAAVITTAPDAKAGATKTEREDGLVDPVDIYYKERLLNDLNCVLTRGQGFDEARRRLISAGVRFDKITGVGRDEKENRKIRDTRNALRDVVGDLVQIVDNPTRADEVRVGYLPQLEHLVGLDRERFLKVRGLQRTAEEEIKAEKGIENTPDGELNEIIATHSTEEGQLLFTAQRDVLIFIKNHIRDEKYKEAINRAKRTLEELQTKRSQRKGAFGLTETQLREQYGIETGNSKDEEQIVREIKRPILGNEIPIDFMAGGFQSFGEKRRALNEHEAFSYNRTAELLSDIYAAHLESYNGEVTNKSDLDTNLLARVDGELRRKRDALKVQFEAGMKGQKGLIFSSLIPFSDGSDPFGLSLIRRKILETGFVSLTFEERQAIPEMNTFEELNKLLVWHDAETELIRTLQTIRSFSTAKEIDTMAALGKSPDRLVMKTSSIITLWSLGSLDGKNVSEGKSISDDTDEALRVYGLIAQSATEPVGAIIGSAWEVDIKNLVREFLAGSTEITEGLKPKKSKYILNRFSMNLSPEKLARVEAFVDYMVTENVVSGLRGLSDPEKLSLLNKIRSEVQLAIDKSVTTLNSIPEITVPALKDRQKRLGIDHAVAFAHVTGLADKWSANLEYEERKESDPSFLPSYVDGGEVWVGKIKVGIYPACTAGAEVANYSNYIMSQFLENRLVASQVLVDELLAGGLSGSLAHSFFTNTAIAEGTRVVDLWKMWWEDEQSLKKVAERMRGRLPENAIQGYFSSISNAKKLADILLGTDTSILKEIDENAKAQAKINVAITFGLGMPYGKEKDKISNKYRAMSFAGPLIYGMGFSGQLTTSDVISAVEDTRKGLDGDEPVRKYLKRIIRDYIGSTSDDIAGLNHVQSEELRRRASLPKIAGAMDRDAIKTFAQIVEKYHLKARKKKITQATLEAPSVLDNVIWGNTEGKIPYATIWSSLLK